MRKVLIGLAVFVFAVALVILIGPQLVPADRLKDDIARQVEAATGRNLAIDGDLSFTLLPAPGVSVGGVRLSNVTGAAAPDMVRLKRATVVVALIPLLSGTIEVDRIILIEPRIDIERLADGRASWDFSPQADTASAASGPGDGAGSSSRTPAIALNDVVIRDGSLIFRDGATVETVTGINAVMKASSLQGPFQLDGALTARAIPLKLRATVGELGIDRGIPISVVAGAEGVEIDINTILSGYPSAPRLAGSIGVQIADAGVTAAALSGQAAPALLGGRAIALEGTLTANVPDQIVGINDFALRFGDINATGALDFQGGATPRLGVVLNAGQVDLDALMAPGPGASKGPAVKPAGKNEGGKDDAGKSAPGTAAAPVAGLPKGLAATVEVKVENILYRDGVVRQARFAGELANGTLTVSQLSAQLPGGSDVSMFGFVETPGGQPLFDGEIEANSDNLRAMLGWLDVDVGAVPAQRLRKLAASAAIRMNGKDLTVTDLDVAIDTMKLRGGVAVALRDRPGFGIGLSLDKIDLDAYMPARPVAGGKAAPATGGGASKPAGKTGGGGRASTGAGTGLAALDRFDAIIQAKIGEVVWRGTPIRGVNLDGTLQGGNLDLRDASVASLGGAQARFSGTLTGVAGTPSADLTLLVDAPNAENLLRLVDYTPPVPIGAARLDGSLVGDFDGLKLDVVLQALKARAAVRGTLKQPLTAPAYDLELDVSHAEAARLFAVLNGETPGATKLGLFGLKGTLAGTADAARVDLTASVGAGSATLKGDLKGLAEGAARGGVALDAAHPDLTALIRAFEPDYRPALASLGPLQLNTKLAIEPQTVILDKLEGKAGPVAFKGKGSVVRDGVRPKLIASLQTSEIIVDWFLPKPDRPAPAGQKPGGKGAGSAGGAKAGPAPARSGPPWSREPIDLSALRSLDAEIDLAAPAITYSGLKVDDPRLTAVLLDGTLDLTELSGKTFGGTFGMTGQLVGTEVPQLRYAMQVKDTDAASFINVGQDDPAMQGLLQVLFPVSSIEVVSGKLGADIDLTAHGRSELELVSNLAGKGAMTLTDALIRGIDTCRVSDQLGKLNGLEGFLLLLASAQGGETRIANYAGSYTLDKGIATLPKQTIEPECAIAEFSGTVDLPRWTVDTTARATFPAHKKFPGLIIAQKGPLDAPNIRLVNSNAVQQYIIGNAAELLIRKLAPPPQAPAATQPGGQQPAPPKPGAPQQPAKPADQFRNLLDGLIKR